MGVTSVILPKLGLTMDEGKLMAWLKNEGDRVEAGEVLFEVETDKATMEVESPVTGYVRKLLAAIGETVPVTQVIALISATADEPVTVPSARVAPDQPAATEAPVPLPIASRPPGERILASPAARKRASELGVDLGRVRPAKGDRISVVDVEAVHAAEGSKPTPVVPAAGPFAREAEAGAPDAEAVRAPLSRMRRSIAERMTQSFRDVKD